MSSKKAVLACFVLLLSSTPVLAETSATRPAETRQEIREQIRDQKRLEIREKIQSFKNTRANLKQAKLLTKTDTVLTVEKDGQTYTINISDKTQLRRRFWGKATLSEFAVGDLLDIHGKWVDDQKTVIHATLVRDTSIQLRFGAFFGTVKNLSNDTIILQTEKRGDQTIIISSVTSIVNRNQEKINLSDLKVGHRLRVKGLWNNQANTITEVKEIKNFSLPKRTNVPPNP